ncbi:MAG: hypothetical protein H0T46_13335 [Deltaproteobacteria bacterium]|nr:hypothetical protein [Deltaproteobacteria bacterium]
MLFDQPRELPVATVRRARTSITAQLAQWIVARWSFLRPRMVPVIVAAIGMVLVINAVNYLAQPQVGVTSSPSSATFDPPPSHIKLVLKQ